MFDLRISSFCVRSSPILLVTFVFTIVLFFSVPAFCQNITKQSVGSDYKEQPKSQSISLPATIPNTVWRAVSALQTLNAEQTSVIQDADVYLEYGLQQLISRTYTDGQVKLTVEIFEMRYPSGAFGLFTFNRISLPSSRREFFAGRFLVSLSSDDPHVALNSETVSIFEMLFSSIERADPPSLILHLPETNKIEASEVYILGPAALRQLVPFRDLHDEIDFSGGVEVASANYQNGREVMNLIIIEYHTPQSATAGYEMSLKYLAALPQEKQAQRLIKREGNYVIHLANIHDVEAARLLINQIKYTMKVYWEGRKFTSIPLEFRPPDPAALEEATETAKVLIRTFYSIGLILAGAILLGVFTGWTIFFWRRYRQRQGFDNAFSDAGETIRLNLDNYVLQPGKAPIKLLGKGDTQHPTSGKKRGDHS